MDQDIVLVVKIQAATIHVRGADKGHFPIDRQRLRMQQAADIFVDIDPRREKVGIIASAGGAYYPRSSFRAGKMMVVSTPR